MGLDPGREQQQHAGRGHGELTPKFQMPDTPIISVIEALENPHDPRIS